MSNTPMWVKICSLVLSVLLLIFVFYGVSENRKQAAQEANRINRINQQVMKCRLEKSRLEAQLETLNKESIYTSDKAMVMAGFVLTGPDDLSYIQMLSEKYTFSPVLLLNCDSDTADIMEALKTYTQPYGLTVYVPAFSSDTRQQVTDLREQMANQGLSDTGLIFVNGQPEDSALQELTANCGLSGYLDYHDTPASGQNEDGSVYIDYAYFRAEHYTENAIPAIEERISDCANNRAAMVCLLDMKHLNASPNTKSFADRIMKILKKYDTQYGVFSSAADAVAELKTYNHKTALLMENYAQKREEIQTRLTEIENQIDALLQP